MPFVVVHSPLLGAEVEVRIEADADAALRADAGAIAEFDRLTAVFSMYDESSELRRWRRGDSDKCSPELTGVLAAAQSWHSASDGAFHPAIEPLRKRWLRATMEDRLPDPAELAELAAACVDLPYTVIDGQVQRLTDCSGVNLNAIAKGYIVDRATEVAMAVPGVDAVMIKAGGDLRHLGNGSAVVGSTGAAGRFDPQEARWRIRLARAGLSTSGSVDRGLRVKGQWLGHVLDPRTGWPVVHTTSASVIATDAVTADALVTALCVLTPERAIGYAERAGIACLVVTPDGVRHSSRWPAEEPTAGTGAATGDRRR